MKSNWCVVKVKTDLGFRIGIRANEGTLDGVVLMKNLTESEALEFGEKISKETGVPMIEEGSSV